MVNKETLTPLGGVEEIFHYKNRPCPRVTMLTGTAGELFYNYRCYCICLLPFDYSMCTYVYENSNISNLPGLYSLCT